MTQASDTDDNRSGAGPTKTQRSVVGVIEIHRAPSKEFARVNNEGAVFRIEETLAFVPKSISRLEVAGNKALAKRLAGTRFEIVGRLSPSGAVTGVKG